MTDMAIENSVSDKEFKFDESCKGCPFYQTMTNITISISTLKCKYCGYEGPSWEFADIHTRFLRFFRRVSGHACKTCTDKFVAQGVPMLKSKK